MDSFLPPTPPAHPAHLLLTGSSGFLGRHWLEALRSEPAFAHVRPLCLARDPASLRSEPWFAALGDIPIIQGDLFDWPRWRADLPAGVVAVLHGAAQVHHSRRDPGPMMRTNVDGTLAVASLAATIGARMVMVSTSGTVAVSSRPSDAPDEGAPYADAITARWPYYQSKILAEKQALAFAHERGMSLTIIRPPVMLGPGDHRYRSTGNIIRHLRRKLPFVLPGGMHYVDIRDAARAMVRAALLPSVAPIYHLVGHACSVPAFFRDIEDISGVPGPRVVLPAAVARSIAVAVDEAVHLLPGTRHSPLPDPVVFEMGAHHWGLASTRAEADLGYASRPHRETLSDTIAWLREHHPMLRHQG